jgi:energy-coupling factor transporter ATPase
MPLIRAKDLSFTYLDNAGKAIPALKGIELTIQDGEFVALVGANGSGKSTLAKLFNGLLLPTRGEVYIHGESTHHLPGKNDIRKNIAMVFQNPETQAVATTVEEDVAFGPENLGIDPVEIRRRVDWSLEVVGLTRLQKRAPHHLSGGQKQRLALAGVLAMQPRCIIFDEATSMLDPEGRRSFQKIIKHLHAQGVTVIMITQDMDEAILSDRVLILSHGSIVRDGSPRDVMVDGKFLQSVGLDLPPMTRFSQMLHDWWIDFPGNLLTASEVIQQISARIQTPPTPIRHTEVGGRISPPQPNAIKTLPNWLHNEFTNDNTNIIDASGLWHTYLRGTPLEAEALRGVDFWLKSGEFVGIIGATGSGKSTLLQHLNGLLLPQAGTLRVGSEQISCRTKDLRSLRQKVALLFQQPEDQLFERYLADDVAYGPLNLGLSLEEVRRRVGRAMTAVGLPLEEFRDRSIYSLSSGERRRAAIAGVLALEPEVLVLDEATAGLDPRGRKVLTDLLRNWQIEGGRSIVWASHSMDEISQVAGRITVLSDGRVVKDGSPAQVFRTADELTSYGLDVPQIVQVLNRVAQMGFVVDETIFTIEKAATFLRDLIQV